MRRPASIVLVALVVSAAAFAACSSEDTGNPPIEDTGVDTGAPIDTGTGMDSTADTSMPDTASMDSFAPEAEADTAPEADAGEPETGPLPFSTKLSEMSLYSNFAAGTVAPGHIEYTPSYELWADGLTKRRWIALPAGKKIDNTDWDHWQFPIGTRFWKDFSKAGKHLETRLIERTGVDTYLMGTYVWEADQSEATWHTDQVMDIQGTGWDSPSQVMCQRCHDGEPGKILGFSAIQLADAPGAVTIAGLAGSGLLKVMPTVGKSYGVPGTKVEADALGYLHANCGHCHNSNNALTYPITDQTLRLFVDERVVSTTTVYKSIVNQHTKSYFAKIFRVKGADAPESAVYERMSKRNSATVTGQMPPIATKVVHVAGAATVKAWIDTLPPPPDGGVGDAASGG
jgi:hypothetical protein